MVMPPARRAAWRAALTLLPQFRDGWLASFVFLPEGEDPDSLVRSAGRDRFLELADNAVTLSGFLFDHLAAEVDLDTLEGRARLVELAPTVAGRAEGGTCVPEPSPDRSCSASAGWMPRNCLDSYHGETGLPGVRLRFGSRSGPRSSPSLVRRAITLLLHHPQLGTSVDTTVAP